jgi:hypothetical protein
MSAMESVFRITKRHTSLSDFLLILFFSLILTSSSSVVYRAVAQTPSSLTYFYPFAKNFSEISIHATATDTEGCVYLAGTINDTPRIAFFPIGGDIPGFDATFNGEKDGFVLKLDPSGKEILFSTFIGGSDMDRVSSICLDDEGKIYIAGDTVSQPADGFPIGEDIPGFRSAAIENETLDGFLIILDPSGTEVVYSSYIGGSSSESMGRMALDHEGNIYLTGYTLSTENHGFPIGEDIPGYDTAFNSDLKIDFGEPAFDAFVMKLDPTGMKVLYSTYLGGKGYNTTDNMVIDSLGRAHVTGALGKLSTVPQVYSEPFIWKENLLWEHEYENEEFASYVILNPKGTAVTFSAVPPLHGRLRLDSQDHTVLAGEVNENIFNSLDLSEDIPGFTQEFRGQQDIGVMILDTTRKEVLATTYLGGTDLQFMDLYVDKSDQIYILGYVNHPALLNWESEYIPVTEGLHQRSGYCFLIKMDPQLETILYASHFESMDRDKDYFWMNMCVDDHEQAYIAGHMPETLKDYSFVMKVDTTIDARASEKTNQDPVREDTQKSIPSSPQVLFWMIFLILLLLLVLGWIRVRSKGKKSG